ncbi:SDR family NAD(P)-dependent oxidoreductase, partial [Streptomyces sp. P17]|uniref:SDR family NAD(P)-dependent oxidoreductase n=1 Tax=Streptomyces sp. P17 TaxID=3074716 RepID=UPI0028F4393A
IARRLAQDGIAVAINYATGKAAADALVEQIQAAGGRALAVQADLAYPPTAEQLFDAAENAFVKIDILVNNAGVMELAPLAEMS